MIYRQFKDKKLSYLGMGNMRLPKAEDPGQGPSKSEKIDQGRAREIIQYAHENGVNYFDTAYRYHGGESETFSGKVLEQYKRDSFYLATKMPGHMMIYEDKKYRFTSMLADFPPRTPREVFEEQLEKCRVDYFDFYLLHNVSESSYEFYTNEEIGVVDFLLEQKKAGRIHHLGFSTHGGAEVIDKFLSWQNCFEFVQPQMNYMDWYLQDAKSKYDVITRHGVPIIAMEPCRGGRLASLTEEANAVLKARRPNDSIASWAFRYMQSLPNVAVVLSGMSTMEQVKENLELFNKPDPATEDEKELLYGLVKSIHDLVPCTACRYCCESCPQGLDIPRLLTLSDGIRHDNPQTVKFALEAMTEKELPGSCINCGACNALCPQEIDIPSVLKRFSEDLLNPKNRLN